MNPHDRLNRAVQKIVQARGAIVRVAAGWQAGGIETSPLADPLLEIQEALAQLESLANTLPPAADIGLVAATPKYVGKPAGA